MDNLCPRPVYATSAFAREGRRPGSGPRDARIGRPPTARIDRVLTPASAWASRRQRGQSSALGARPAQASGATVRTRSQTGRKRECSNRREAAQSVSPSSAFASGLASERERLTRRPCRRGRSSSPGRVKTIAVLGRTTRRARCRLEADLSSGSSCSPVWRRRPPPVAAASGGAADRRRGSCTAPSRGAAGYGRRVTASDANVVALADGSVAAIRPIAVGDGPVITATFEALGPESRYRRFLQPMSQLSERRCRSCWMSTTTTARRSSPRMLRLGSRSPSRASAGRATIPRPPSSRSPSSTTRRATGWAARSRIDWSTARAKRASRALPRSSSRTIRPAWRSFTSSGRRRRNRKAPGRWRSGSTFRPLRESAAACVTGCDRRRPTRSSSPPPRLGRTSEPQARPRAAHVAIGVGDARHSLVAVPRR